MIKLLNFQFKLKEVLREMIPLNFKEHYLKEYFNQKGEKRLYISFKKICIYIKIIKIEYIIYLKCNIFPNLCQLYIVALFCVFAEL